MCRYHSYPTWFWITSWGVFSPSRVFSCRVGGCRLVAASLTCLASSFMDSVGAWYQRFLSYFCAIKSLIFCSSLESGSAWSFLLSYRPSQTFLQNCWVKQNNGTTLDFQKSSSKPKILHEYRIKFCEHFSNTCLIRLWTSVKLQKISNALSAECHTIVYTQNCDQYW